MRMFNDGAGLSAAPAVQWLLLGALALGGAFHEARASCGAAFCMVNTSWNVQGAWTEPGLRFDLRYEYIDQDQPRHGSSKVGVGQIGLFDNYVHALKLLLGRSVLPVTGWVWIAPRRDRI